jgi:hypothetical protein
MNKQTTNAICDDLSNTQKIGIEVIHFFAEQPTASTYSDNDRCSRLGIGLIAENSRESRERRLRTIRNLYFSTCDAFR